MALPFPTKVVLPFDIATAQDMNERHANDVALANGSGLDDGAIATSGTSSNGSFTKFRDGTLICRTNRVATTYGSTQHTTYSWTYPEPFISVPSISITPDETGISGVSIASVRFGQVISSQMSETSAQLRVRCDPSSVANPATLYIYATAIGRWK